MKPLIGKQHSADRPMRTYHAECVKAVLKARLHRRVTTTYHTPLQIACGCPARTVASAFKAHFGYAPCGANARAETVRNLGAMDDNNAR